MSAPELGDETLAVAAPPPAAAGPLGAAAGASMVAVYSDHNGGRLAVPRWICAPAAGAAVPPIVVGAAVPQNEVPGFRLVDAHRRVSDVPANMSWA